MANARLEGAKLALKAASLAVDTGWTDYMQNSKCHELSCGCATVHIQEAIEALDPETVVAQHKGDQKQ